MHKFLFWIYRESRSDSKTFQNKILDQGLTKFMKVLGTRLSVAIFLIEEIQKFQLLLVLELMVQKKQTDLLCLK